MREDLIIMASKVVHDAQRLTCFFINQAELAFLSNFFPPVVDEVGGMRDILGFIKLPFGCFPKVFSNFSLQFGELLPGLQDFDIVTE